LAEIQVYAFTVWSMPIEADVRSKRLATGEFIESHGGKIVEGSAQLVSRQDVVDGRYPPQISQQDFANLQLFDESVNRDMKSPVERPYMERLIELGLLSELDGVVRLTQKAVDTLRMWGR
jgi:hypothetical protein